MCGAKFFVSKLHITVSHQKFSLILKVVASSQSKLSRSNYTNAMFPFLYVIFGIGVILYLYLTWNFDYWKRRGVAGPQPRPYVGTFPKTAMLDKSSNYISETSEIFRYVDPLISVA